MNKGFTIVETLVAVTVLMIAISGPLTVSFRALNAATASRNQMIATFLAQDVAEYTRNIKDNNIGTGNADGWLAEIGECTATNMCSVDTVSRRLENTCDTFTNEECILYQDVSGRYSHTLSDIQTPFNRTMYIKDIRSIDGEKEVAELVVDVVWSTGEAGLASTTLRTNLYNIAK